ncbi:MAG: 2-aminoadipate transaminase, partial [Thermoleophilaceae bacterium]|nr:2-aminoadipate transaminase [Thermoleophilaceae bacterium]
EPQPTLHSLDGGVFVMYLGTFSKILSPGIRLGWVVAPPPVLEKINMGKQGADLCTSTLSQLMVEAYFEQSRWRDYVESLTEIYRKRRDTMLDALAEHFPARAEWTHPSGGLFIWVTLPEFIDTTDLLARALRDNVAFVPGSGAYLDGRGHSSMRLNFSNSSEDELREGIRRIGKVIGEQVALYDTLTGEEKVPLRTRRATPAPPHPPAAADELTGRVVPMPRRARGGGR